MKNKDESSESAAINEEMQALASMFAHDFRAPMVNLKGFSQELGYNLAELKILVAGIAHHGPPEVQKDIERILDSEIPEAMRFIDASVNRMDGMVKAVLESARLGRRPLNRETVDMNELVATVLASYNHHIERAKVSVEVGPLTILSTDRLAMEQIVGNLVDNAIKYLDPGRPGQIKIGCTDGGGEAVFSIRDNGRGVAHEDQCKIFQLFWRGNNEGVAGEGIGLAYIATLLRRLGGRVSIESEPGVGTEVTVTLPKVSPLC